MIKKPKINFTDVSTISIKDISPISPFFPTENQSQNWIVCGVIFTSHVTTIEHLVKQ